MNIIQDVLIYQTQMMRNSSLGPYVPADFSPPEYIVIVNALFYASLGVMLLAAFIAMLIKSWVREFDRGLRAMSIPEQRAKTREFRYLGMKRWKLPEMVAILPLLIQISLLLFSIGLALFLFHISKPSFGVTTAIFAVGILYYITTTSISVFATSSPFHSPLSRALTMVYRHSHAYFCPCTDDFLSEAMDTTPSTILDHVRWKTQVILQKSRPYLEKDFVNPIETTRMDEVQLSTAASVLQRIHESAPNSQHSEALQWSVWQVAGSATLQVPPLFDLPSWILDRRNDEEYFSRLPPAMLVALVAVWLRARRTTAMGRIAIVRDVLQRVDNPNVPWAQLVIAVFDRLLDIWVPSYNIKTLMQTQSSDITTMIRRKELPREESLWLLSTLSELCSEGWLTRQEPFLIGICSAMLLGDAPKWDYFNPPDIVLLEAVVTLAAVSCCPARTNRLHILTSSREHPWLLLNIRNPTLIGTLFEGTPSEHHKELISLLFLVVYALIYRDSYPLAAHYFTIITTKGDLPLYTSALTAIAPAMKDAGLSAIGRMLVAPQTQEMTPIIIDSMFYKQRTVQEDLLRSYDRLLGVSENPDPNILAILLMLSKHLPSDIIGELQGLNLELKNPWLKLAARVVARLKIPDGSDVPMGLFYDHRVHNMIAAMSLLRYTRRKVTQFTESRLLASFLESREHAISSISLECYMKTAISRSGPPAPSCYLSSAVHAAFNLMLPDHQLQMGWEILEVFVSGYENLPVEWRRTFAQGFFTLSRQQLPPSQGDIEANTSEKELRKIITWEYFHGKEREAQYTDTECSGLDWMAIAWSLHLSQQSGTSAQGSGQGAARAGDSGAPTVNKKFVLQALCKLLEAAQYHYIIPIIPKIREFVHWFDDTELLECRNTISAWVEEAVRRHREFHLFHEFHKYHCMWYI